MGGSWKAATLAFGSIAERQEAGRFSDTHFLNGIIPSKAGMGSAPTFQGAVQSHFYEGVRKHIYVAKQTVSIRWKEYSVPGRLISYGISFTEFYRQAGFGCILSGFAATNVQRSIFIRDNIRIGIV